MSGILAALVGGGINTFTLNVTGLVNPNIQSLATAQGWLGKIQPIIIVNTGQVNTLDIPASMDGADITLDLSNASFVGGLRNGGTAIKTRAHIKIKNAGTIAGGGGQGGTGGSANVQFRAPEYVPAVGWGYGGAGGNGQGFAPGSLSITAAQPGSDGTDSGVVYGYKDGGSFGGGPDYAQATGGTGGNGGAWGAAGTPGGSGTTSGDGYYGGSDPGAAGQAGGKAIDGNSYITWIMTGSRIGSIT